MVLLSRAAPGLFTHDQILHHVPLATGRELIHAGRTADGEPLIWPDPALSKRGRWWSRITDLFKSRRG